MRKFLIGIATTLTVTGINATAAYPKEILMNEMNGTWDVGFSGAFRRPLEFTVEPLVIASVVGSVELALNAANRTKLETFFSNCPR
jgi:hypothetical protein